MLARGGEGGDGAVQLAGGVSQGLLEPVVRRFSLLLARAVVHRGSAQELSGQRRWAPSRAASSAAVSAAQPYGLTVRASSQPATSSGAAASV